MASSVAATAFAAMWAMSVIFHLLAQPGPLALALEGDLAGVQSALVGLAAVCVLWRPSSPRRLVALATLQVIDAVWQLPVIPNHWMIQLFVNSAILAAAASLVVRDGIRGLRLADLFAAFAPAARWILILSYSFAAFAKLNGSFFDPTVSCATEFSDTLLRNLGLGSVFEIAGTPWAWAAVLGTASIEALIPVLVLIRRARLVGIGLALAFHFLLALDPISFTFDFSSILFALFFLFLPDAFWRFVAAAWRRWQERLASISPRLMPFLRTGLAVSCTLLLYATTSSSVGWSVFHLSGRRMLWLGYGPLVIVTFAVFVARRRLRPLAYGPDLRRPPLLLAPIIAIVALNGAAPYLGLKTGTSFTMFSNLRTEGGRSNHFVIRRTLHLTGFSDDLIVPISSTDPEVQQWAELGLAVTFFELRDELSKNPDAAITYRRDGRDIALERASDQPDLVTAPPAWQRRLLIFRPIDSEGPIRCRW